MQQPLPPAPTLTLSWGKTQSTDTFTSPEKLLAVPAQNWGDWRNFWANCNEEDWPQYTVAFVTCMRERWLLIRGITTTPDLPGVVFRRFPTGPNLWWPASPTLAAILPNALGKESFITVASLGSDSHSLIWARENGRAEVWQIPASAWGQLAQRIQLIPTQPISTHYWQKTYGSDAETSDISTTKLVNPEVFLTPPRPGDAPEEVGQPRGQQEKKLHDRKATELSKKPTPQLLRHDHHSSRQLQTEAWEIAELESWLNGNNTSWRRLIEIYREQGRDRDARDLLRFRITQLTKAAPETWQTWAKVEADVPCETEQELELIQSIVELHQNPKSGIVLFTRGLNVWFHVLEFLPRRLLWRGIELLPAGQRDAGLIARYRDQTWQLWHHHGLACETDWPTLFYTETGGHLPQNFWQTIFDSFQESFPLASTRTPQKLLENVGLSAPRENTLALASQWFALCWGQQGYPQKAKWMHAGQDIATHLWAGKTHPYGWEQRLLQDAQKHWLNLQELVVEPSELATSWLAHRAKLKNLKTTVSLLNCYFSLAHLNWLVQARQIWQRWQPPWQPAVLPKLITWETQWRKRILRLIPQEFYP